MLMGGFEQKSLVLEGSRLSLRVTGDASLVGRLPTALRDRAATGLTGIMYGIDEDRLEILVEGDRQALEPIAEFVEVRSIPVEGGDACLSGSFACPG